ncbi:MAG: hypothetical protein KTR28_01620 [Micavibrio sp.]|nr:hypothetical protein [Micavibrio sp.]
MSYKITKASVFTGELQTFNNGFEADLKKMLVEFGKYAANKFSNIYAGCDDHGRASHFYEAVRSNGGFIEDTRPEFYHSRRERRDEFEASKVEGQRTCLNSALDFKRNLLSPGGVRIVFPGFIGTLSEKLLSMEESDTARRIDVDEPLIPIIVFNVKRQNGRGAFDGVIETLENTIADAPFLADRRNLLKLVSSVDEAKKVIEAYERLGPKTGNDIKDFVPVIDGRSIRDFHVNPNDGLYLKALYKGSPNPPLASWDNNPKTSKSGCDFNLTAQP